MLQGTAIAAPPCFAQFVLMSAATASHTSALRLETTTRAPSAAICSAMDLPMPLVEPVMTATLPDRSNIGGMSLMRFLACVFVRAHPMRSAQAVRAPAGRPQRPPVVSGAVCGQAGRRPALHDRQGAV